MNFWKELALKWKFFTGGLFFLKYSPHAYLYSLKRDRLSRKTPSIPPETIDSPGKLINVSTTERGASFYFEQVELEITFLKPDLVRLDWKPGILPIPYAIARHEWDRVTPQLQETEQGWQLASLDEEKNIVCSVLVDFEGGLKFIDSNGQIIREELPPEKPSRGWRHKAVLRTEEHIYGLGERIIAFNLRSAKETNEQGETTTQNKVFRMWNFDAAGKYGPTADPLYLCIPVYLGLHELGSYLVFYENSFEAKFIFDELATAEFEGGALRYYFILGKPQQLLERYTELTGRPPLPPRWAFGYHQSRWGYAQESAIRQTYKDFETNNLPLSAIHLDIDVMVDFRAFTIDPQRFPKLGEFIRELDNHGVKFVTILNPGIKYSRHNNLFLEGQILDAFCKQPNGDLLVAPVWPGWCVFPDFTNPVVRRWWARQYEYLLEVGVAGFWHDMNEPAAFILWGDRSLPKITRHCLEGRGGDHCEAHNVYGLLQAEAGYESLRQYRSHLRPFIISRAGWAGLQRYAWTWTGDIESTWAAMRQTMTTVIGLGLSGIPYSGPDIGGFQGNPSAELYLRWFQMSCFLTFCRTHSSNNVEHRSPWTYGEPSLSIIREFLKLRYRLLPYFYTLAYEASQKGVAPVRPVFWADPQYTVLWDVDDAFLLGDALMVCPVTEEGALARLVIFPKGSWYSFWDDTVFYGPTAVELASPKEQIPLLVKAGSILPTEEANQLTLHLYLPENNLSNTFSLYTDAGDGYGESRIDNLQWILKDNQIEIIWSQQGDFPFPYSLITLQLHGAKLAQARIDDVEIKPQWNSLQCDRPFQRAYLIV